MPKMLLLKLFFCVCLFLLFLIIFGQPAIERYLASKVVLHVSHLEPQPLVLPAITICVDMGSSWKTDFKIEAKTTREWIEYFCGENLTISSYYDCHRNYSYSKEEIIFDALFDYGEVELEWREIFQVSEFGVCQTTQPNIKINTSSKFLMINLNTSLPYKIFLHDPKLFLISINPKAYPRVQLSYSKDTMFLAQMVEATRYKLLNRKVSPCQEDPEYSFTSCLIKYVHEKAGCEFGLCSELEQVYNYLNNWTQLMFENDRYIQRSTGCLFPCTYVKYEKSEEPMVLTGQDQAMLSLSFSTNVMTVMEEELVYPMDSFVAEFGGALGLFLGFSFMMIWDLIQFVIASIKKT